MATTRARPDFKAYQRAMRAPIEDVVGALRELLGARLVAYIGSVSETRATRQWAEGARKPPANVQRRLRIALQVALVLTEAEDGDKVITQSWFQGLNPQLEDRSPATLLREGDPDQDGAAVIAAARAFLAGA